MQIVFALNFSKKRSVSNPATKHRTAFQCLSHMRLELDDPWVLLEGIVMVKSRASLSSASSSTKYQHLIQSDALYISQILKLLNRFCLKSGHFSVVFLFIKNTNYIELQYFCSMSRMYNSYSHNFISQALP